MRTGITPVKFRHYLDTVAYFFPMKQLPRADWASICKLYGDDPHRYRNEMGMLVSFQCPQPDLLEKMAELCDRLHGNLTRYDISSDAIGPAAENLIFIKEHLLLMRRKGMPIKTFDNIGGEGFIYCPLEAPRNIAGYADFSSKLDPQGPDVAKFDLRLRGRAKSGVDHHALVSLSPTDVILRNVRFVEFDRQLFERETFRKVMEQEKGDLEQAKARIRDIRRHYQFDFVQRAHDYARRYRLITNNRLVCFEHKLTWGAQRRSTGRKDLSNEINIVR